MDKTLTSVGPRGRKPSGDWTLLIEKRRELDVTQAQLGKYLGVDGSTISDWELLNFAPQRRLWAKLAQFLNITVGDLASEIGKVFPLPSHTKSIK
jgi:DNA-binding XRE family transcriptional regulator